MVSGDPFTSLPGAMTPLDMSKAATQLYGHLRGFAFNKHKYRPYICPFHQLLELVPKNSTVLDVGCGSGIFAGLILSYRDPKRVTGVDSNPNSICIAQEMAQKRSGATSVLHFEHRDARLGLPEGQYDIVSLIDVLHHVPPKEQGNVIFQAAERVVPGGILLYKDLVERPLWRAWANRVHDLILAREWIHYVPLSTVISWGTKCELLVEATYFGNMLWYGHECVVFRKPEKTRRR